MTNCIPLIKQLPFALYRAEQVKRLDQYIIQMHNIPGTELMQRAGTAAWQIAQVHWPQARDITVVCGIGNNGGDGYVLASLALAAGCTVRVLQLGDIQRLSGDALTMAQQYWEQGGFAEPFQNLPRHTDLLVDAVFGTGLERNVSGAWATALDAINQHNAPVLALDIPSGLNADTGTIMGCAVRAKITITFIALKQGMFTAHGAECCGETYFAGLQVPATAYRQELLSARRMDWNRWAETLTPRPRHAHKSHFGHVLLIGGAPGMGGALRLAAEAAARSGAGLVTMATHPQHAAWLNLARPELMCYSIEKANDIVPLLARATVIAIGPGLGQSAWAKDLLQTVLTAPQPLVLDADALNLLATAPQQRTNWVLTPHPGEAARMLNWPVAQIQHDRFTALDALSERYGGNIVLKGSGTLVRGPSHKPPAVCNAGNPGMASGGMGDALTGIIAGLIAQGWELEDAACMGVCLHAAAGDRAAAAGERGLLAGDLFPHLRTLLNVETGEC